MSGSVVVGNDTGHTIHVHGCGTPFQVALMNNEYKPTVLWLTCLKTITIPIGNDRPRFVFIAQVSTDGAAAEAEMLRRLGTDALTTSTPQTNPLRRQEIPIEVPECATVVDLLHPRVHGDDPTQVRPPGASTPPATNAAAAHSDADYDAAS